MNRKNRLLLVEDDPNFGTVLKDYLELNEYEVTHAVDGNEGLVKFKNGEFDLAILDVMMPYKDGFTLAKEIKELNENMPIIFLTAKSMKEDVVKGYQVGADDYLNKPFDSEVLLYKIKAILHRKVESDDNRYQQFEFEIGGYQFNSKLRFLIYNGVTKKLSPKENELLKLMCIYLDDLMPRELALTRIWKDDNYFTSRSMDVYVAKLRKYLSNDPNVEIINIHGEGFRLVVRKSE